MSKTFLSHGKSNQNKSDVLQDILYRVCTFPEVFQEGYGLFIHTLEQPEVILKRMSWISRKWLFPERALFHFKASASQEL
jgi:hypothetical protein